LHACVFGSASRSIERAGRKRIARPVRIASCVRDLRRHLAYAARRDDARDESIDMRSSSRAPIRSRAHAALRDARSCNARERMTTYSAVPIAQRKSKPSEHPAPVFARTVLGAMV
jgi:hypothetical protein